MTETTKKSNRGGAREGAGRHAIPNAQRRNIVIEDEVHAQLKQIGGTVSNGIRVVFDYYRSKHQK